MKVGVKKAFRDKFSKELRKPGDIIEVTEERGAELIELGYVIELEKAQPEATEKKKNVGHTPKKKKGNASEDNQ